MVGFPNRGGSGWRNNTLPLFVFLHSRASNYIGIDMDWQFLLMASHVSVGLKEHLARRKLRKRGTLTVGGPCHPRPSGLKVPILDSIANRKSWSSYIFTIINFQLELFSFGELQLAPLGLALCLRHQKDLAVITGTTSGTGFVAARTAAELGGVTWNQLGKLAMMRNEMMIQWNAMNLSDLLFRFRS